MGTAQSLSNAELLAVFFGTGNRGGNAVDLAHQLLARFGSLRELRRASEAGAGRPPGAGPASATACCRPPSSSRASTATWQAGPALESRMPRARSLLAQLRDRPYWREVFCCMHLNTRHQLIAFEELFRGTLDGAGVHPQEVVKAAIAANAAAIVLAHNHPSGVAEPSQADELITQRLRDALGLVDVRVLDHVIVGD